MAASPLIAPSILSADFARLGEQVLAELLGLDAAEIGKLMDTGTVAGADRPST